MYFQLGKCPDPLVGSISPDVITLIPNLVNYRISYLQITFKLLKLLYNKCQQLTCIFNYELRFINQQRLKILIDNQHVDSPIQTLSLAFLDGLLVHYRLSVCGGSRGGPPPLFWVKKEEMTEGRKAGRASKIEPGPLLS